MHAFITIAALLLAGATQPQQAPRTPQEVQAAADRTMTHAQANADASIDPAERMIGFLQAVSDPPRDEAHPARNRQLVIPAGPVVAELHRPAEMNALFFQAAGAGPHPTLLLLHGLPGNERNLDLAQAVRRAGWNVLTFTYRGAWGSEGRFSIGNAVEDTAAALRWLRSPAAVNDYGVDRSRIVLAGHSMGGYMAANVASADRQRPPPGLVDGPAPRPGDDLQRFAPYLAGVILIDAWDISADEAQLAVSGAQGRAAFIAGLDDLGHALGPVTAEDLYSDVLHNGIAWNLNALAPNLSRQRVLTIFATHGGAEPNRALAERIRAACLTQFVGDPTAHGSRCPTLTAVEINSDHSFADSRVALAREVVTWLRTTEPGRLGN